MLETILDRHMIFVLMGILTAVGIMSKFIVNVSLKRLVRAAGNMNKSTHPLMRLVRAKFEHASMVSDKVENVKVFVDKYLYEYKVLGLRLHSWRRLEKAAAALCLLAGAVGAGLEYGVNGMSDLVWKTGAVGGGLAAFVYMVHLLTDEKYQLEAIRNYMVDFLENVCRHRFEKSYQKEIKVLAQDGASTEFGVMPGDGQGNSADTYAVKKKETAEDLFAVRNLEQADESLYAPKSDEPYAVKKRTSAQGQSAVSAFLAAELKAGESVSYPSESVADEAANKFRTADLRLDEGANTFHMAEPSQNQGASGFRTQGGIRNEKNGEVRTQGGIQNEEPKEFWIPETSQSDGINAFRMPEPEEGGVGFRASEPRKKEPMEIEAPRDREKRKENIVEIPIPEQTGEPINPVVIESPETSNPSNTGRNAQNRQVLQKERTPRKEKNEEEVNRDLVIRRILEEFMA